MDEETNTKFGNVGAIWSQKLLFMMQALTNHSSSHTYTYRIGKTTDNRCLYCGGMDDGCDTCFEYPTWNEERRVLEITVRREVTTENMTNIMIKSKEVSR